MTTTGIARVLWAGVTVCVLAAGLAFAAASPAAAQPITNAVDCAASFRFAEEPVPVVKTADGETVLASVEWGYSADHNLCYLALDDRAIAVLRANEDKIFGTTPPQDAAAAARCHRAYNPQRGFAAEPVPVVKTADGQTVLATVRWGYSAEHNLCYLVLDDSAVETLRRFHDEEPPEPGTALQLGALPAEGVAMPAYGRIRASWREQNSTDGQAGGYEVQWRSGNQDWNDQQRAVVVRDQYTIWGLEDGVSYTVRVRLAAVEVASDQGATISAGLGSRPTVAITQDIPPLDETVATSVLPFDGTVNFEMEGEPVWPATIELPVDVSLVPEDGEVLLFSYNENLQAWIPQLSAEFDRERGVLTAEVYHLSGNIPGLSNLVNKGPAIVEQGVRIGGEVLRFGQKAADTLNRIIVDGVEYVSSRFYNAFVEYYDSGTRFLKSGWEKSQELISNIPELAKHILEQSKGYLNANGRLLLEAATTITLGPQYVHLLTQAINQLNEFGHGIDEPECARGPLPEWVNEGAHSARTLVDRSSKDSNAIRDCLEPVPEDALEEGTVLLPVGVALNVNRAIPMRLDLDGAKFGPEPSDNEVNVYEYDIPGSFGELLLIVYDRLLEVLSTNDTLILPSGTTTKISVPKGVLSTGTLRNGPVIEYLDMSLDVELLPWTIDILILAIEVLIMTASRGKTNAASLAELAEEVIDILGCAWSTIDAVVSPGPIVSRVADLFSNLGLECFLPNIPDESISSHLGPFFLALSAAKLLYNGSRALPDIFTEHERRLVGPVLDGSTFTSLSLGYGHTCGIRDDGTVSCWGDNRASRYRYQDDARNALANVPDGQFTALSSGDLHACGIRSDRTVACWGDNGYRETDVPDGQFTALSARGLNTCGIRTDRTIACWSGANYRWGDKAVPPGQYTAVSVSGSYACGIRTDRTVACSDTSYRRWADHVPDGHFTTLSSGPDQTCGIKTNGTVACWGDGNFSGLVELIDPPRGTFTALSVGFDHVCGIGTDGMVACSSKEPWLNSYSYSSVPQGQFASLSSGSLHACGIRTNGTVACWGNNSEGRTDVPDGQFTSISTGAQHACGIKTNGTVACWGDNYWGQTDVPS